MKILPVHLFSVREVKQNPENSSFVRLKPMPYDSVCFSGAQNSKRTEITTSPKMFKKMSDHMVDFYTGLPMLKENQLKMMKESGFFRGNIGEVVKKLKPLEKYQYIEHGTVEEEIYNKIVAAAEDNPDIDLTTLFRNWYSSSRKRVRKLQKPTFDRIKELGAQLPEGYVDKFYKFMSTNDRKLFDEPIIQEFSAKDFEYKMTKFLEKCPDENMVNRIMKILEDLDYVHNSKGPLPEKFIKKIYNFKNLDVPGKKGIYYKKHMKALENDKQAVQLKLIHDIGKIAEMKGYKKIERLCDANMDMLNGVPVYVPFSNKAFVYDLDRLLDGMPDEELKKEILETAKHLPTSSNSADAFILKYKDAEPDVIGDRLYSPALVSIEHLVPQVEGGPTTFANCALARRGHNSTRGHMPLYQYLEENNFNPYNQEIYVDHLVQMADKKLIGIDEALEQILTIETEGHLDFYKQKTYLLEKKYH